NSRLHVLGLTPGKRIVVYDAETSVFAARAWWLLRWLGYQDVVILDGGWRAWCDADGAQETTTDLATIADNKPSPAVDKHRAKGLHMPIATASELEADLADPAFTLIDARDPVRYRGEQEPLDPVAGHVPGAINRPAPDNLQADGHFKSPEALRQAYTALLEQTGPEQVVHYCGSGIT